MKRALKRWWVYLAAVPLADGKSAFRLGRSLDMIATLRQLNEGSPLHITRVWALPTSSERAACAAVAQMRSDLSAYLDHGAWMHMRTNQPADKESVRVAMEEARKFAYMNEAGQKTSWTAVR